MSTVKFLFDEDFNGRVVRGLRRRLPNLDTRTVPQVGLRKAPDPTILEQAASEGRVVVSHDHNTMRYYAEERLMDGLPMPGLILVRQDYLIGQAIEELVLIAEATTAEEWRGLIIFFPLEHF